MAGDVETESFKLSAPHNNLAKFLLSHADMVMEYWQVSQALGRMGERLVLEEESVTTKVKAVQEWYRNAEKAILSHFPDMITDAQLKEIAKQIENLQSATTQQTEERKRIIAAKKELEGATDSSVRLAEAAKEIGLTSD